MPGAMNNEIEIYQIIRANQHRTPKQIIKLIKDRIPELSSEEIATFIRNWTKKNTT